MLGKWHGWLFPIARLRVRPSLLTDSRLLNDISYGYFCEAIGFKWWGPWWNTYNEAVNKTQPAEGLWVTNREVSYAIAQYLHSETYKICVFSKLYWDFHGGESSLYATPCHIEIMSKLVIYISLVMLILEHLFISASTQSNHPHNQDDNNG